MALRLYSVWYCSDPYLPLSLFSPPALTLRHFQDKDLEAVFEKGYMEYLFQPPLTKEKLRPKLEKIGLELRMKKEEKEE